MTSTIKTDPKAPKPKKTRKSRGKTRGALAAIGALLLASALVRVGIGAGEAFAREEPAQAMADNTQTAQADTSQTEDHDTMAQAKDAAPERLNAVAKDDILPLIEALNARESRVRKREEELDVRLQALAVAEQEIERKLTALEAAEQQLRATMALAQTAAEDDLAQLTEVYANMKPKQAAALFEQMDPDFAAGFLGRMRSDSAAAIMAGMPPEKAYLVSVILAGRNAGVPDE